MSELRIVEGEYPAGEFFGVFYLGSTEIGRADKVGEGWRLPRSRKVLPEVQAAKAMIDRMLCKARDDEAAARKLLGQLRTHYGRLPPDGSGVIEGVRP